MKNNKQLLSNRIMDGMILVIGSGLVIAAIAMASSTGLARQVDVASAINPHSPWVQSICTTDSDCLTVTGIDAETVGQ